MISETRFLRKILEHAQLEETGFLATYWLAIKLSLNIVIKIDLIARKNWFKTSP
ncbi:MAG: hypothetical protein ABI180_14655 [Microcoleus sp.]